MKSVGQECGTEVEREGHELGTVITVPHRMTKSWNPFGETISRVEHVACRREMRIEFAVLIGRNHLSEWPRRRQEGNINICLKKKL